MADVKATTDFMDSVFKFKIGDILRESGVCPERYGDTEIRHKVLERLIQQCSGGVQLFYVCRPFTRSGNLWREHVNMNESEVELVGPYSKREGGE